MKPTPSPLAAVAVGLALAGLAPSAHAAAAAPTYKSAADQFAALKAAAKGGQKKTGPQLPDWSGYWLRAPTASLGFDPAAKPGTTTAMLKPAAKAAFAKRIADIKAGRDWDRLNYCLPPGFPRDAAEPGLREFVLRPEQVQVISEQMNSIRRIYTDGSPHTPDDEAYPLWEGDSVGFWNGDTLVVHTSQMKDAEFAYADVEHSDKIETVEVIRKIGPDTIQDVMTLYDPDTLARPWRVVQTYVRDKTPDVRLRYYSCAENNNVARTADGRTRFVLPGEKDYKDPATFGSEPDRAAGK